VALTNGVHMLDRIAALTGQSITFEYGRAGFKAKLGDVEDTATLSLSLSDGTPVQVLAAWPRGGSACDDELTLYGTGGTLRVWAWRGWRFEPLAGTEAPSETASYSPEADSTAAAALAAQELIEEFYLSTGVSHVLAA
jgi:predicted dehydrogenase